MFYKNPGLTTILLSDSSVEFGGKGAVVRDGRMCVFPFFVKTFLQYSLSSASTGDIVVFALAHCTL